MKARPTFVYLQWAANRVAKNASQLEVKTNYRLGRRRKPWWFETAVLIGLTTDATLMEVAKALRTKFATKGYSTFKATPGDHAINSHPDLQSRHIGHVLWSRTYNGFSVRASFAAGTFMDPVILFDAVGDK